MTTSLSEVDGVEVIDCERLGIKVITPELIQLVSASAKRGKLSFRDHLCLIVSSALGFVCVTNDKSLRSACIDEGVQPMWGLELMIALVKKHKMRVKDATRVAEEIHQNNPFHIPRTLIDNFVRIVRSIQFS